MALNHPTDDSLYLDDAGMTYSAGAGTMVGLFSPSNKSSSVTLADSNKTAELPSGGAYHMARGPVAITGEAYIEFTINQLPATTGAKIGVGLINSVLTNYDAALTTSNTAGFFAPNNAGGGGGYAHATGYGINGGSYTSVLSGQEWVVGTVIGMAISMSAKTVKITLDGTTYSSAMDITALGTTIYPAVGLYNTDDSITLNAGDTPFEYVPPSGYSGPDVGGTMTTAYGHVDGSPYIFEFGTDPWRGFAAFEPSILDLSSGDEVYNLIVEGNTASDFSGTSHDLASWNLRALNPQDVIVVDNGYADVIYPYGRLKIVFSGTTPSIRLTAFLKPLADAPTYTLAEQLTVNVETLSALSNVNKYIRDWSIGPSDGGPNHDGTYPMVDGIGNVIYVKSPQQILADAGQSTPFGFGAIGDGNSHPASDIYDTLSDCQAVYPFATSLTQELDFLAWQKAIYTGRKISSPPVTYKMCNSDVASQKELTFVSGDAWVEATGAKLDFSAMTAKTTDEHLYSNYDFEDDDGWVNASIWSEKQIILTTFGDGEATMIDIGGQTDWTIRASATNSSWQSVCWSAELSLFCAVGAAGAVMTSSDGVNWMSRTAASSNDWQSVCWSAELSLFCAVARSGTGDRVMTSSDGVTWTAQASAADSDWRSICWSAELGLFCAVAIAGTDQVMTSSDGEVWTPRTAANTNQWISVCWAKDRGIFCAVANTGTGNRVMTSPDGAVWTARASAADNDWQSVCWSSTLGMFCAVANTGTGNRVMTSTNGAGWTIQTSAADNNWSSVCWSKERGMFCAVASSGTGNRVMESKNGTTWYSRTSAADNNWRSICYAVDLFCAVASTGSGDRVMTAIIHDSFFQWGRHLVSVPVGKYTVTCDVEATLGGSYALGNYNPPYFQISFFRNSPGDGPNDVGRDSGALRFNVLPYGTTDARTISFDFNVPVIGSAWLTVSAGGYGNFRVTKLDIKPALLNCAVLLTRDGASDYYPIMQPLAGVWIYGPGVNSGLTGVLWKSYVSTDGNVPALERCNIINFEYGIETSDGAYLMDIVSCNIFGNRIGYRHRGGINSGENIRFDSGGIFNNSLGIDNSGGAEINILHTAIDYNLQAIINNAGTINMDLLRLEQDCDASTPGPIIHCLPGGKVTGSQMRFLGAGEPGTMTMPPIQLDSALSSCTFDLSDVYNLSSASGLAASGPGLLRITNLQNNGNPNIGRYLLSEAPAMDVLNGAGLFEPQVSYIAVSSSGIYLEGGLYAEAPHTQIDQWNSDITTISVTTAYAYSGTRCLKISKATSDDLHINDQLHITIPVQGTNLLGGFRLLMPHDQSTTGTIYYRLFWVRVIGHDSFGRPIYGPNQIFKGETDIPVPLEGAETWITRSFGTLYENDGPDAAKQAGIRPPVWATHLLLLFDHMSIPAMTYYIDDLRANAVG